jgi:hypothetical protein
MRLRRQREIRSVAIRRDNVDLAIGKRRFSCRE